MNIPTHVALEEFTILQCVQNTKRFIFSRFTILSCSKNENYYKMHTILDHTKSTHHVEMSMWVWLVGFWHGHVSAILYTPNLYLMPGAIFVSVCSKLHIVDVVCGVQWNLSSLIHCTDTFETISGVYLIEVSWFQGLVKMQIQH